MIERLMVLRFLTVMVMWASCAASDYFIGYWSLLAFFMAALVTENMRFWSGAYRKES